MADRIMNICLYVEPEILKQLIEGRDSTETNAILQCIYTRCLVGDLLHIAYELIFNKNADDLASGLIYLTTRTSDIIGLKAMSVLASISIIGMSLEEGEKHVDKVKAAIADAQKQTAAIEESRAMQRLQAL